MHTRTRTRTQKHTHTHTRTHTQTPWPIERSSFTTRDDGARTRIVSAIRLLLPATQLVCTLTRSLGGHGRCVKYATARLNAMMSTAAAATVWSDHAGAVRAHGDAERKARRAKSSSQTHAQNERSSIIPIYAVRVRDERSAECERAVRMN